MGKWWELDGGFMGDFACAQKQFKVCFQLFSGQIPGKVGVSLEVSIHMGSPVSQFGVQIGSSRRDYLSYL